MRKLYVLFLMLLACAGVSAQNDNHKISYQAVVRNAANQLMYDTDLTVAVELANSENGPAVYAETHAVHSNANGLISLLIGDGTYVSGSWDAIHWNAAWVKATISKSGTTLAVHHLPLTAVPFALYADQVNPAALADYLTENHYLTEEVQVLSISHDTVFLTGGSFVKLPAGFSGNYNDLTNKPLKSDLCDSVQECVTGWISDSTRMVYDSLHTYYATTNALKDSLTRYVGIEKLNDTLEHYLQAGALCDSLVKCEVVQNMRDSIRTNATAIAALRDADAALSTRIQNDSANLVDFKTKVKADSITLATRIFDDSTALHNALTDTASAIRSALGDTATAIRNSIGNGTLTIVQGTTELGTFTANQMGNSNITIPTPAEQAQSDWKENNASDPAYIQNKPNIRDSVNRVVLDSLSAANSAMNRAVDTIVRNNIHDSLNVIRTKILTDSLDLVNRIVTDSTALVNRIVTDSTVLADKMHADSLTLANRIVTDSTALVNRIVADSNALAHRMDTLLKHVCDSVKPCVTEWMSDTLKAYTTTDKIDTLLGDYATKTALADSMRKVDTRIKTDSIEVRNLYIAAMTKVHTDSLDLVNRIVTDSTALHNALKDTASAIRGALGDTATAIRNSIGNGTLTIVQGTTELGTFTANQMGNSNITIPTPAEQAQSDWKENNASDPAYIQNKPNIRDSVNRVVLDSLSAANSAMNRAVDTIVRNNIHDSLNVIRTKILTDSLDLVNRIVTDSTALVNRIVADSTALANRIVADSTALVNRIVADSNALAHRMDTLLTHVCDSVETCVKGWISDSTRMVYDSLHTYYVNTNTLRDTAAAIRGDIPDVSGFATKDELRADSTVLANRIVTDSTVLANRIVTDSTALVNRIVTDSLALANRIVTDSMALADKMHADSLTLATRMDTVYKHLCDSVMACDGIQTMQTDIRNNTTNITALQNKLQSDSAALADKIHSDSLALVNRIVTDSTALVNRIVADSNALAHRMDTLLTHVCDSVETCVKGWISDSTRMVYDSLHTYYVNTNTLRDTAAAIRGDIPDVSGFATKDELRADSTVLANRIVTDSTALADKMHADSLTLATRMDTVYKHLCDSVMACDGIQTMQTDIRNNTTNITALQNKLQSDSAALADKIHSDSLALVNRIVTDSTALHKAIKDTAAAIRNDICDSATVCITKALADPTSEINHAVDTIARNNIHDTATAIRNSIGNGTLTITYGTNAPVTFNANQKTDASVEIPAPGEGTLTIKYGNQEQGTFNANQSGSTVVSIPQYNGGCDSVTFCQLLQMVKDLTERVNQLEAANCPSLGSINVSDVTFGSATVTAIISNYDPLSVQEFGFLVSTSEIAAYDEAIKYPVATQTAGMFTMNMTGLQPETTYYVRAYALNNPVKCTQSTMVGGQVQWQTAPFAVTLSNTSFCKGESITVSATAAENTNIGTVQYVWSTGQNTASFTDTPEASGDKTYTVSATYGGYTVTASATATVKPTPDATIIATPTSAYADGTTQVFIGTTQVTLSVEEQTNAEYIWSTNESTHSIVVSPTEDTKYVVTATIGDCTAKDSITLRIEVCPTLSKVMVEPTPSVEGSVTLSATMSPFAGEVGDLGFLLTTDSEWTSDVDTLHITPIPSSFAEGYSLTQTLSEMMYNIPYYFKAYMKPTSADCTADVILGDTAKFELADENFKIIVNRDSVCAGDTVTLTAPAGSAYNWSTGATTQIIKVAQNETETKTYSVTVTTASGDKTVGVKVTTTLKPIILHADSVAQNTLEFYLSESVDGANYVWNKNGSVIAGANTNHYTDNDVNITDAMVSADYYGVSVSLGNCTVKDSVPVKWVANAVRYCGNATVSDHQGNIYNTVVIGPLCWTRENLKTTQYFDEGTQSYVDIPDGSTTNYTPTKPYLYSPTGKSTSVYGYFYNWLAATGNSTEIAPFNDYVYVRGVCPEGWHLPSYHDASYLVNLDYTYWSHAAPISSFNAGMLVGGQPLETWIPSCGTGTSPCNHNYEERNSTGFSAIQTGMWDRDPAPYGQYREDGAWFWTCLHNNEREELDNWAGFLFWITNGGAQVEGMAYNVVAGTSVRCVRDPQPKLSLSSVPDGGTVSLCGQNSVSVEYTATMENANPAEYSFAWSVYPSGSSNAIQTGTGNPYSAAYTTAGDYTVSCTATKGAHTLTATIMTTVSSEGEIPSVDFCVDSNLTVTVWTPMTGNPTSIDWGDGHTESGVTKYITHHSYSNPGTYNIVVSDAYGCPASTQVTLSKPHTFCTLSEMAVSSLREGIEAGSAAVIDSVKDHQGNWYEVVQIGNQCWLKENMRCTTTPSSPMVDIVNATNEYTYSGKMAKWYNNAPTTYAPMNYGLLYNWNAAMDVFNETYGETSINHNNSTAVSVTLDGHHRGICPIGWHVPSDAEWTAMESVVNKSVITPSGPDNAWKGSCAGKLSTGCNWTDATRFPNSNFDNGAPGDYNSDQRNQSGFSALPAGFFGDAGSFAQAGPVDPNETNSTYLASSANFWSSTQNNDGTAWSRTLMYRTNPVGHFFYYKSSGRSVRCLRDTVLSEASIGRLIDLGAIQSAEFVAQDGDTLINTLGSNSKISIAAGATITLRDATINGTNDENYSWAGISCEEGDATIILEGTNNLKGFYEDYPGVYVAPNKTITIQGTGSLTASSNGWGAGIGGGVQIPCGNVVVNGGTINATGGQYAAGIGSGLNVFCGNITINEGTVTAIGGDYGAGIGAGFANDANSGCGDIQIDGGNVTATGGQWAAGIGSGLAARPSNPPTSTCGDITISGGIVVASGGGGANMSTLLPNKNVYCPGGAGIGTGSATSYQGNRLGYSSCGNITIGNGVVKVTAEKGSSESYCCSIGKNCDLIVFNGGTCGTVTIGGTIYWDGSAYQNGGGDATTGLKHSPYVYEP